MNKIEIIICSTIIIKGQKKNLFLCDSFYDVAYLYMYF